MWKWKEIKLLLLESIGHSLFWSLWRVVSLLHSHLPPSCWTHALPWLTHPSSIPISPHILDYNPYLWVLRSPKLGNSMTVSTLTCYQATCPGLLFKSLSSSWSYSLPPKSSTEAYICITTSSIQEFPPCPPKKRVSSQRWILLAFPGWRQGAPLEA